MRTMRLSVPGFVMFLITGCAQHAALPAIPPPPSLSAGVGEEIAEGHASIACTADSEAAKAGAIDEALRDAVTRAATAFGNGQTTLGVADLVKNYQLDRFSRFGDQCVADVHAVIRTSLLQRTTRDATRDELRMMGRPLVAFAVESYRILPNTAVTTRRAAAEVIDSLQQELITRGFDVRRTLKARNVALANGGEEVVDISSAARERIAAAASRDGITFLVQGEIKVTDEGMQADGQYLAVVDGSLEVVELKTDRVVGAFRDVAAAEHLSASAAYTKAISGFARAAGDELSPQMLDTWRNAR